MIAPLAAALALAAAPAPKLAPLALRFAWPDGAEATRTERLETMGALAGERGTSEVIVRVARAGEEWRVTFAGPDGEGGLAPARLAIVAGPDGAFRRFDGEEAFRAGALQSMRQQAGDALNAMPGMREAQEQFVTGFLESERERWAQDVSRWAGKALVPGATVEELRPAPAADGIAMRVRSGLRRALPCPGDPARTCVELWEARETDEVARREACAARRGEVALGLQAGSSELVVFAEPDTLVPHSATWSARWRNACRGGIILGEARETAERRYAWRR